MVYPWPSQTVTIVNNIDEYRSIHITGQLDNVFISKTISPLGMMHDALNKVWKVSIEGHIDLEFSGVNHRTLKIKAKDGYKILSIYGER